MDKKYSRAFFDQNSTVSQESSIKTLLNKTLCYNVTIFVQPTKEVYQEPLKLKLKYEFLEKVEDQSKNFCDKCVKLNTGSPDQFFLEVPFESRCSGKNCTTNLAVEGKFNSENPFLLGSAKTIEIMLVISNSGEEAHFTKLKVSASTSEFSKIPNFCAFINQQNVECNINSDKSVNVLKSENVTISLQIDAEKLDGKSITISANVTSEGEEFSPKDNNRNFLLSLKSFSEVEVIG